MPALRSPLDTGPARDGLAGGASSGPGRGDAFRRGRLVHALLQHLPDLPDLPAGTREAAARRFLAAGPDGLAADEADQVAGRLLAVLADPLLAPLFSPDALAEQPVSGVVDGVVVTGQIDRLRVLPDLVLLCDFKTNRRTPAGPAQVPVPYLRQMAAYRALLAQIYPGRRIACALVWTQEASVMMLESALLDAHGPGTYRTRDGRGPPAA